MTDQRGGDDDGGNRRHHQGQDAGQERYHRRGEEASAGYRYREPELDRPVERQWESPPAARASLTSRKIRLKRIQFQVFTRHLSNRLRITVGSWTIPSPQEEIARRELAPAGTMTAFVMNGLEQVGFAEKPIPAASPTDAIVMTTHALICTSDSHTVHGAIGPREGQTLGHEAVGIVNAVGSEVRNFKPGDRVVVGVITLDWLDDAAQMGHPSQSNQPLGGWKFANIKDGVFAEYFHVNQAGAKMATIPDSVPSEAAVHCADMLSTGFVGAELANIPIGGTVAIDRVLSLSGSVGRSGHSLRPAAGRRPPREE